MHHDGDLLSLDDSYIMKFSKIGIPRFILVDLNYPDHPLLDSTLNKIRAMSDGDHVQFTVLEYIGGGDSGAFNIIQVI